MNKVMTAKTLVEKAVDLAKNYKTVYALGMFGSPVTESIIQQKKAQYPDSYTDSKVSALRKLIGKGYYGFDCVCYIKALLWGWRADPSHVYGGATYGSNGVEDYGSDEMDVLTDISTDFNKILPGEQLCMPGHVAIYIGDGLCVECSPKWSGDVQITAVANIGQKAGYNSRTWKKHGKIKYIDYSDVDKPAPNPTGNAQIMSYQSWINRYLPMQYLGAKLEVDGKFGPLTRKASIKCLQYWLNKQYGAGLAVDGSFGPLTKAACKVTRQGASGVGVYILQGLLYCHGYDPKGFDGSFGIHGGTGCLNAVKAYQRDHGLDPDGEAGPLTFAKLCAA